MLVFICIGIMLVGWTVYLWLSARNKKKNDKQEQPTTVPPYQPTPQKQGPVGDAAQKSFTILYSTVRGSSRQLAHKLFNAVIALQFPSAFIKEPSIVNAAQYDAEQFVKEDIIVFVLPTYEGGTPPPDAKGFASLLKDMSEDFRYGTAYLAKVKFAVFGLGDKAYGAERFNTFAKDVTRWMRALGAKTFSPPVFAGSESQLSTLFPVFSQGVARYLKKLYSARPSAKGKALSPSSVDSESGESSDEDEGSDEAEGAEDGLNDLEDIVEGAPLLYDRLEKNLKKQGYQIIGTHSAVKLCRWTKAMLRGRGGCYKHTFYNIASYQCMEMTPSLACANKCIFCWRHHTNPVARQFQWQVDSPEFLVEQALAKQRAMVKQMKGVEGVVPERLAEAMKVRHCALSLVGEPIMYPEINRFIRLLHKEHISSFMVTNSQFPERIRQLTPVTQLYCSIDGATAEDLKRIDRPLFEDYWERCIQSVKELSLRKERTVFRLTLVNAYNTENVAAYARLIRLGNPDFIEIKGVTYCGDSKASDGLTMKNVPFHQEVLNFCADIAAAVNAGIEADTPATEGTDDPVILKAFEEIKALGPQGQVKPIAPYSIACEHAHSCCVLIAKNIFQTGGVWHTWLDLDKFFDVVLQDVEFNSMDYSAPTPSWACYQSPEQGFDPKETRVHRKGKKNKQLMT